MMVAELMDIQGSSEMAREEEATPVPAGPWSSTPGCSSATILGPAQVSRPHGAGSTPGPPRPPQGTSVHPIPHRGLE